MYYDNRKTVYFIYDDDPKIHEWRYYEDYELNIAIGNSDKKVTVLSKGMDYRCDDGLLFDKACEKREQLIKEGVVKNYE